MSQLGGVRHCCLWAVPAAMALLGATVAGCEYQDGSTPAARATSSAPVTNPLAGPPTKPAEVAVLEQGNRTKLDEVLGVPVPDTYLDVTEAISGRMTSYLTRASLPASGTYVITTACIGTTNARLVLSQRKPGNASGQVDFSEAFACAEPSSRTLDLHAGDVTVDVINLSPDGSTWGTGAFANVRITFWKP
jgi:hypothetical protein